MSLKNRYPDRNTGQTQFAWYGPLNGTGSTFERNCSGIIGDKPHAGSFGGKLLDHRPAATYNHEDASYDSYFETAAPPALDGAMDLRWLYARTYYDGLGDYTLTVDQESQGISGSSGSISTTGGGGALGTFVLDNDIVGTIRMVSKDIDLS